MDKFSKNSSLRDSHCPKTNVFIWDMDETLILLKSLLDGSYAEAFDGLKDIEKGKQIGKRWENHILEVCDELFYYDQIEDYNEPFLDSLSEYDDGRDLSDYDFDNDGIAFPYDDSNKRKLAYRHRAIAQKYQQGLEYVLDERRLKVWNDLYDSTNSYTNGWLSSAAEILKRISCKSTDGPKDEMHSQNINVLVTSGALIPSLVKCLLYRVNDYIPYENVYSSCEVGKLQCFSWIKERFSGPSVRFCVIGDGMDECRAAHKLKWPFVHINIQPDGTHRFPGLTTKTLGHYMDLVYGDRKAEPSKVKNAKVKDNVENGKIKV